MPNNKKLIVHIGVHKTGSSAIQYYLWRNAAAHRRRGVLYPFAGRPNDSSIKFGHHEIAWALLGHADVSPDVLKYLSTEILATDASTIILSSEEFDRLTEAQIAAFAAIFPAETQVVMYYRRQSDILQGLYGTEIVFNRYGESIETFAASLPSDLNFHRVASHWAAHVGRDNMIVRAYDRSTFPGGDIIPAFLQLAGLPEYRPLDDGTEYNVSLPWYAALAVQRMWRLDWPDQLVRDAAYALTRIEADRGAANDFMPPSAVAAFDQSFAESNAAFHAEFAQGQPPITPAPTRSDEAWHAERNIPWADLRLVVEKMTEAVQRGQPGSA